MVIRAGPRLKGAKTPPKSFSVFGLVFSLVWSCHTTLAYLIETSIFSTTNGIWKLSTAALWARGDGHIDYANVLYLSFAAVVTELSGYYGVSPAGLLISANIFFIAAASGLVALSIMRLKTSLALAVGWALAFGFSGSALTTSLGSEDIAGAVFGISLVFYLLTFIENRHTLTARFLVGFSLSLAFVHLWEWRAALPLYLGIAVAWLVRSRSRPWLQNLRELIAVSGLLLVSLFAAVWAVVAIFRLSHNPAWFWPIGVIFPGKGLGTVWGGFALEKVELQFVGLSENVIGGRNLASFEADNWTLLTGLAAVLVYLFFVLGILWGLNSVGHKFTSLAGIGTWVGGVLFAIYTQPQDPQMQVTQSPQFFIWAAIGAHALSSKAGFDWRALGLGRLLLPVVFIAISLSHFQGTPPIWKQQNKPDAEFFEAARTLQQETFGGKAILYGSGWETQLAWISLANGGDNINHIGFHGPFDKEKVNGFFPVSFIAANPTGSPKDWVCASVTEFKAVGPVPTVLVDQDQPLSFTSFRTITSDANVDWYQQLWLKAYGNGAEPKLEASFAEAHCEQNRPRNEETMTGISSSFFRR